MNVRCDVCGWDEAWHTDANGHAFRAAKRGTMAARQRFADEFVVFIGWGHNQRGAFPKNLTELNADCQEFAAAVRPTATEPAAPGDPQ